MDVARKINEKKKFDESLITLEDKSGSRAGDRLAGVFLSRRNVVHRLSKDSRKYTHIVRQTTSEGSTTVDGLLWRSILTIRFRTNSRSLMTFLFGNRRGRRSRLVYGYQCNRFSFHHMCSYRNRRDISTTR